MSLSATFFLLHILASFLVASFVQATSLKSVSRVADVSESCGDGGVVCKDGLTCYQGVCFEQNAKRNSFCGEEHFRLCRAGLECSGPRRLERCVKAVPKGGPCAPPYWSCAAGRMCIRNECRDEKLGKFETCMQSEDCRAPLFCALDQAGGVGRCVTALAEGEFCSDSDGFRDNLLRACGPGLTCMTVPTSVHPVGAICKA